MPDLNEREKFTTHTCDNCAFCCKAIYDVPLGGKLIAFKYHHFCVVDGLRVPGMKVIVNEVPDLLKEDGDVKPSAELLEILQIDASDPDITKSPRYVHSTDCCQFYEQGDFYKDNKKLPARCIEERLNVLEKKCEELDWKMTGVGYAGVNLSDCMTDRIKAIWRFLGAPDDPEKFGEWHKENTKEQKKEEKQDGEV